MNLFFRILVVLLLEVTVGLGCALADCVRDRNGAVYCSQHPGGGAVRDNSGAVTCGKGQCRRDRAGNMRCSNVVGGGAETDYTGGVKCLGGCEPSSESQCTKALE
jgi:hypothetical protein